MPEEEIDLAQQAAINGRPDIAEDLLRARDQTDARVRFNLGWHELRHGNLSKGIEMLDAGRPISCYGSPPIARTLWNPATTDPRGKTILLRSEGGYGDEIIGFRFASVLARRGARVIVACHPSLMALASRVEGVSAAISTAAVHDCHADYWLPGMSAPWVLGLEFPDHPGDTEKLSGRPYLAPDPALAAKWRGVLKGKIKVGLRWRGSPKFEHQQFRTFDPAPLFALANIDSVECYSLQRDEGSELLPQDSEVANIAPMLTSWDETAAVISCLDLVVTSCTSVAHLAAALGVPTWVVVPCMPYYCHAYSLDRTMTSPFGGDSSPWYDTMRLFRQTTFGDWDAPLLAVHRALRELAGCPSRPKIWECDGALVG
jgi:hypothetical protein